MATFVISPGQPLRIRTTELWRAMDLRTAVFEQMREATTQQLESFFRGGGAQGFFDAYTEFAAAAGLPDGEGRLHLGEKGWVRMQVVDPCWSRGNPVEDDVRF